MFPHQPRSFKDSAISNDPSQTRDPPFDAGCIRHNRKCRRDHCEEFADREEIRKDVEFSPHVAETQRMFSEEQRAVIPFTAVLMNFFPDGVG